MCDEMAHSLRQHSSDQMDSEIAASVPSLRSSEPVNIQTDSDPNERPPTVVDRYFSKHYRIGEVLQCYNNFLTFSFSISRLSFLILLLLFFFFLLLSLKLQSLQYISLLTINYNRI